MKNILVITAALFSISVRAQNMQLTVDQIMKDPKWMGNSPANPVWSYNSKSVLFNWNPENRTADSIYKFDLNSKDPVKGNYQDAQVNSAINNGNFNTTNTQIVYTYRNDLYLLDLKSNKTIQITKTEEAESNPSFFLNNEWIVFTKNQNLFAWSIAEGITQQLTNFARGAEAPAAAAGGGFGAGRGGGGRGGGPVPVAASAPPRTEANKQDKWLQEQALRNSDILQERKRKTEERTAFLKTIRERDTLKIINVGDRAVQSMQISPSGRFVTYRLYTAPANVKNAIVPSYVTESGYTTDIPNRSKVGAPIGKYDFYIYDKTKDTVIHVLVDSIPGSLEQPEYMKDYPSKTQQRRPVARNLTVGGLFWNDAGTSAMIDISAADHKDRWIMQLEPLTGNLSLADRQHDSAWIAGPGIGGGFGGNQTQGWIDGNNYWFQSEATGYSHLYVYNVQAKTKKALTSGNYEVQRSQLSQNKKMFYYVANEDHPGKQNWYRIKVDGTGKEKITSMPGGYEVAMSPDEKYIAYRYSYVNKPWELFIQENAPNKKPQQITFKAVSDSFNMYKWRDTKIFTITARDGQPIYARIYEPAAGKKNNAAVIFVHGAGYLQNVHYWWSSYFREYMFNNLLADKGYTVIDIDYRGSAGYGGKWRTGIYRFMGGKDLNDEADAAQYLVKELGIDKNRIGMYGGSYGGFMTLMAMFTQPDLIKAGAALRPVTDWAHYNHGYTSNILNEPVNDSLAYARSSPINFASGLKNHLLICHGMIDTNVNFQDAVRLNQRLIELGKNNWEMALYPLEDHGFVEASSWTDEYKRILNLFERELK